MRKLFTLSFINLLMICLCLNLASCKKDVSIPETLTLLNVSSSLSDYTEQTLKQLSYKAPSEGSSPDVFIVKGSDMGKLSNEEYSLMGDTLLEGKTIIIDSPKKEDIVAFALAIELLPEFDENSKTKFITKSYSPEDMIDTLMESMTSKITTEESEEPVEKDNVYEAIGIRQNHVYFVHDVDEEIEITVEDEEIIVEGEERAEEELENEVITDEDDSDLKPKETDYIAVKNKSIENFIAWINNTNNEEANNRKLSPEGIDYFETRASLPKEALEEANSAQKKTHNYTAVVKFGKQNRYDNRWEGRTVNVELNIYVWTACNIGENKEYYLIQTSTTCSNNMLQYKNEWDDKYCGPYFQRMVITPEFNSSKAHLITDKCSPKNQNGTTSYTSGTNITIGGNLGLQNSGPSAGGNGSISFVKSSSTSIQDIACLFTTFLDKGTWYYGAKRIEPNYDFLTPVCDDPKTLQIQTAVFDTFSYFELPSDTYIPGVQANKMELLTNIELDFGGLKSWEEIVFCPLPKLELHTKYFSCKQSKQFIDHFRRPANAVGKYIISFEPPADATPEEIDRMHEILKTFIPDWDKAFDYYCFRPTSNYDVAVDNSARYYFLKELDAIKRNKNILKERNFKGTCNFYIQNFDTGKKIWTESITF